MITAQANELKHLKRHCLLPSIKCWAVEQNVWWKRLRRAGVAVFKNEFVFVCFFGKISVLGQVIYVQHCGFSKVPIKVMSSYDIHAVVYLKIYMRQYSFLTMCVSSKICFCFFSCANKYLDTDLCKASLLESWMKKSKIRFSLKVFICFPVVDSCLGLLPSDRSCIWLCVKRLHFSVQLNPVPPNNQHEGNLIRCLTFPNQICVWR